ncbi:protein modigliani [Eurosta solidaginis]|uniref:protein modigliani n=1 Tax=Eurosta solidaginis TaxID=178769 RepID=UPI00353172F9
MIKCTEQITKMLNTTENHSKDKTNANKLPKYCPYNKFLLVEELVLQRSFSKLHHGHCTVIGRLQQHLDGYFVLENIKLTHLPKNCILPEGSVSLRVFKFSACDELQIGKYCEIIGEVVLWNPYNPCDNWVPLTPRAALELVLQHCDSATRTDQLDTLQKKYLPAINIFKFDYIECPAAELIERHLKIRLLIQRGEKQSI